MPSIDDWAAKAARHIHGSLTASGQRHLSADRIAAIIATFAGKEVDGQQSELHARIKKAVVLAGRYGSIDGDHHKMWVIDQMVRALLKDEDEYETWRGDPREWDEGIAP